MKAKYFLVVTLLIISGCKKETTSVTSVAQGTWELASTDGAWFGHREYAPGNGNTFIFSGNTYSQNVITTDTAYHNSGTFSIYNGKPCESASEQTLINFDNSQDVSSFSLSGDTLRIGTTECISDGSISTYLKIK